MNNRLSPLKSLLLPLLLLTLLLSACRGNSAPAPVPAAETCRAVLDSGSFSETLEELDGEIALDLYGTFGLDAQSVTGCMAYLSTGATAEECVFLTFESKTAAEASLKALEGRVADQTEALKDYQPQEIAKLEKALTGITPCQEGYCSYLVVANDRDLAQKALQ